MIISKLLSDITKRSLSLIPHKRPTKINQLMLRHYLLAKEDYVQIHKSKHWDHFVENYSSIVINPDLWKNFRRSGVTAGYDDSDMESLIRASNQENINVVPTIPEIITNKGTIESLQGLYGSLRKVVGDRFLSQVYTNNVGSPSYHEYNGYKLNPTDITLTYNSWQIYRALTSDPNYDRSKRLVFLEIGGGFGGLLAQLKRVFPESQFVLLDLPEVNCAQTYYLKESFPNASFYFYEDYKNNYRKQIINDSTDIAILPGWCIKDLQNNSIDVVINIRSMMEMNLETIDFYFNNIHRCVKDGGIFYCSNRYIKSTSGDDVKIKEYPFDDYWKILFSQSSWKQSQIHELLVQRTAKKNEMPLKTSLESLPPWE